MTKAYMSQARHYDVCPCPMQTHYYLGESGALGDTCVQKALSEARAILAESEFEPWLTMRGAWADSDGLSVYASAATLRGCVGEPAVAREALAEGLASWLS